ncbi:hypothetical protein [Pseudazoarcus pumilus]|nr:hypothetical protein [Pseudazoarcus pumilus]
MPITYSSITELLQQHFSVSENPTPSAVQRYRNHVSTLNSYLAFCGKSTASNVGAELGSAFDSRLRAYLDQVQVVARTRRDRASHLRLVYRLHQGANAKPSQKVTDPSCFSGMLRQKVAESGLSIERLAELAHITPATLLKWIRGKRPEARHEAAVHRLESALSVGRNGLTRHIHTQGEEALPAPATPSHRARIAERPKHNLFLSEPEFPDQFRAEWGSLIDYKTSAFPTLERQTRGRWRLIPIGVSAALSQFAVRGSMACPTADNVIGRLRSFFGVLTKLPIEHGGIPWNSTPPITLAWLAHPHALNCYLSWLTAQSGGIQHSGHKVFALIVCNLLRPNTGFLWQQPSTYRNRLPEDYRPASDEAWQEMCAKSHKLLRDYTRSSNSLSRKPEEPIAHLLELPDPLRPLREAICKIEADAAAAPPGSITEARHKRNALVMALLLANPLRARTWMSMTWLPSGQGTLQGSPSQGWRIQLQPQHLKTGEFQKGRAYSVKLANWVKPMLDEYIEEYRNTLLAGNQSDYLLVGGRKGRIWEGFGKTVFNLTRRYIPGSPGFGPHAVRHLVATSWLRKYPGDFLAVAELLNDNLTTVLANYAHLRRDDSFARYEAYIDTLT